MTQDRLPYDVLLVEDNVEIADVALRQLERIGIYARHAPDGRQALAMLDAQKPDLMLLDLNLPEVDGWRVLEHAKKLYGEDGVKVIVMTANDDSANKLIGRLQTVERYLVKPILRDTLWQAVRNALGVEQQ